jgi:MYXO-CTERM domain-containing protein
MKSPRSILSALGLALCAAASAPASASALIANGSGLPDCSAAQPSCTVPMTYRGGSVMTGVVDTYIIWYGDWSTAAVVAAKTLLPEFFNSLTGSEYMNIGLTYDNGSGTPVSNNIHYGGSVDRAVGFDGMGTNLSDADIGTLVEGSKPTLGDDPNGIYFVFTAPGIRQQEDTSACGWHTSYNSGGHTTKYSWVSPAPGCDFLPGTVTGNDYVDSLTETTSHEMFEALTDPNVNNGTLGWYNNTYGEVGDMCVNSNLDANLNGNHFDVQAIWARDATRAQGGMCAAGYRVDATNVAEPGTLALAMPILGLLALRRRRHAGLARPIAA